MLKKKFLFLEYLQWIIQRWKKNKFLQKLNSL